MTLPGVLFLLVFSYIPMGGTLIAFKDFNYVKGFWKSDWSGLKNFEFFFTSEYAFRVTRNTVLMNAAFISIGLVISVAFALMLFELGKKETKIYQTIMFFPYFLSWVVVGYIGYAIFNPDLGALNHILAIFNVKPILWYSEPKYWPVILILTNLWKGLGYGSIIYYTGLMGIDSTYYEAASIDGATKFEQIRMITLPLLTPLITMLTLLQVGRIFYADFGLFYFLPKNSGMLKSTTDVIDTFVFNSLRSNGDFGMAAAAGLYQSLVGFILVITANAVVRKIDKDYAIF